MAQKQSIFLFATILSKRTVFYFFLFKLKAQVACKENDSIGINFDNCALVLHVLLVSLRQMGEYFQWFQSY